MRKTGILPIVLGCLLLAPTAAPVHALNLMFLKRGPVANLTDTDKQLLLNVLTRTLQDAQDGEVVEWHNPDTGHHGDFRVLDTHEDFGTICRNVLIRTFAGGLEGGGRYRLCKRADDDWRFAAPGKPANPPSTEKQTNPE